MGLDGNHVNKRHYRVNKRFAGGPGGRFFKSTPLVAEGILLIFFLLSFNLYADRCCVVMDADSGEVLLVEGVGLGVEKSFPMGSVMKVFSGLYGLRGGFIGNGERVRCDGSMELYGRRVECWDLRGHGEVNLSKALAYSCNVYFYYVGVRLDGGGFFEFLRAFGFGGVTGIDLPNEDAGVVPDILDGYGKARAAVGLSRKLRVTPMQVITAFAAVVNGGKLVIPFMSGGGGVSRVRRDLGELGIGPFLPVVRRGMSEGSSYGTTLGYSDVTGGYAKTGTAPWLEGYRTHGWFVGVLPFKHRRLVLLVFIHHGQGNRDALPEGIELAKEWKRRIEDKKRVRVSLFTLLKPKRVAVTGRFGFLKIWGDGVDRSGPNGRVGRVVEVKYLEPGRVSVVLDGKKLPWPEGKRVRIGVKDRRGILSVSVKGVSARDYDGELGIGGGDVSLDIINSLSLRGYLLGVIGNEMGQHGEALKVQAVVSRTFALKNVKRHDLNGNGDGFDFCDTTHCQHYTGRVSVTPGVENAVESTGGMVLVYGGGIGEGHKKELCEVYFHSTCGGQTNSYSGVWEDKAISYLKSIDDKKRCSGSPHYRWTFSVDEGRFSGFLRKVTGYDVSGFRIEKVDGNGWVKRVKVECNNGVEKFYRGEEFHILMGREFGWNSVKSACFTVVREEKDGKASWVFKGKGLGHGVGLCQWGARNLAEDGKGYKEILKVYFPGAVVGCF